MTLEITEEKKSKIHNLCLETLQKEKITLRTLASASLLSLWVHFFIETWKNKKKLGLKLHNVKFDTNITLNVESMNLLLILTFLTQTSQYILMQA